MELYIEKGFAENFQIEYYPEKGTEIQKIMYSIFSEYPNIKWFLNASEEFIKENELLYKLSDFNLNFELNVDFNRLFNKSFVPKSQTLVLTEKYRDWFPLLKEKGVLCFSYDSYEKELKEFISGTHFKVDLSDEGNIPIDWKIFQFLKSHSNFVLISDSYILCDKDGQKIKNNLVKLLKENLNKNQPYSIFLITKVNIDIERNENLLNRELSGYKAKIFIFNDLPEFENIDLHDRVLYSNYTMTDSGKGFNLNSSKPLNSQIVSTSIFEKYTYKRFNSHFKELTKYLNKLENSGHLSNPYRANSEKAFSAFRQINLT